MGNFLNPAALLRLAACVLIGSHDEWQVTDRRYLSESSVAQLTPPAPIKINAASDKEAMDGTVQRTA